jgi:tripartite-type tricarboxylate transporter receptor subunit TctC
MKLPRRRFLHLAAGAAALPAISRTARAQTYPAKPVRIVVGFAAGGVTDIAARLIGQWLSERLGQQFIIDNRPGAGSNIATELVAHSAADGYTLLLVGPAAAVNATLYQNLGFNFMRDLAPIATIYSAPLVMEVNPSLPIKTMADFIAYARANPGKVNFASAGSGTSAHITAELFKRMASLDMQHVPYRGDAPAMTDVMSGQVQVMFANTAASMAYVRAGRLRALAVTTATRWDGLPDVPTVAESLPGFEASSWQGIVAPKDTPVEIIDKLNKEINVGLADPGLTARLADLGAVPMPMKPAEFGKLIAAETEKWGNVIRAANIKAE